MSESEHPETTPDSPATPGIDDAQLPDDLTPSEDNPLAEGLADNETVDGLLDGGKDADEMKDNSQGE